MMNIHIVKSSRDVPADWNDEEKYPNKELIYTTPEKELYYKTKPRKYVDGKLIIDETQPDQTVYVKMVFELWKYGTEDHKHTIMFAKCPVCGSYDIAAEEFNTIRVLSGAAGVRYTCKKCGFVYEDNQVLS